MRRFFWGVVALGLLMGLPGTLAATVTIETTITVTSCTAFGTGNCPANVGDEFGVLTFSYDDTGISPTGFDSISSVDLIAPTNFEWNGVTYDDTNTQGREFVFRDGILTSFSGICRSVQGGCGTGNVEDWSAGTIWLSTCQNTFNNFRGIGGVFQNGYDLRGTIDYTPPSCSDSDGDGVNDAVDNCPDDANADQADLDGDGLGDACDAPDCGNGEIDPGEECDDGNVANGDMCDEFCQEEELLVVLESFTASPTKRGVTLHWATALELDTVGFRVLRGTAGREKSLQILAMMIPARGTNLVGATYTFEDTTAPKGTLVYYLEDIDAFGRTQRHGPVTIQRGGRGGRASGR